MKRHNPKQALAKALDKLTNQAREKGPDEMLRFYSELRLYANALQEERDHMEMESLGYCTHCLRYFIVKMTVRRDREWGVPSDCPPCYTARSGKPSCHADTFRYCTEKEAYQS